MTLEERVIKVVKINLENEFEVSLESNLTQYLEVDSFSKLMILCGLEEEFSLNIDELEFEDIKLVSDIVDKMRKKYPQIEGE
ncbi:acyl carrier protein [Clostridium sp.]|uniref:acyl carrier protein n=1 Tax=Clostridium sp. TaxID=1506 RepID=UPI001A425124|nr:acyl carrier protein [Clostridium sp.]MBK5235820.1 acyl carrier protein [Clostridium sp.]